MENLAKVYEESGLFSKTIANIENALQVYKSIGDKD
jgi:hypothetical protein